MAGLFGSGMAKPGKGVKKDAPEKKRIFQFFDLFFRKIGHLIKLNLLYLLFCLPIITIGPATAALIKISINSVRGKPVFLFSDFWSEFKSNFWQGLFGGLLTAAGIFVLFEAWVFYYAKALTQPLYWILIVLVILFAVIFFFASFYLYTIMVSVKLNFFALIKNSVLLGVIGAKTNWFTLIFGAAILVPCILFVPYTLVLWLLLTFSTLGLLVAFNSFQYVDDYLIKAYYYQNGIPNPEEADYSEEAIFHDKTE